MQGARGAAAVELQAELWSIAAETRAWELPAFRPEQRPVAPGRGWTLRDTSGAENPDFPTLHL